MIITVDINDLTTEHCDGSVTSITGTDMDDPTQRVTFAGDTRMMAGLVAMVEDTGEVTCVVEPWQVLGVRPMEAA